MNPETLHPPYHVVVTPSALRTQRVIPRVPSFLTVTCPHGATFLLPRSGRTGEGGESPFLALRLIWWKHRERIEGFCWGVIAVLAVIWSLGFVVYQVQP